MSDGAIVRRNIKKPYDNAKIIAPKSVTDNFKSDAGYVISADAKYIAYRRNRKNVRNNYSNLFSGTIFGWNKAINLINLFIKQFLSL